MNFRRYMYFLALLSLSWGAGVVPHLAARLILSGRANGSDLTAALVWSAAAFLVSGPWVFLPVLLWFGEHRPSRASVLMPFAGAILSAVPVYLIVLVWGEGRLMNVLTAIAIPFFCHFGTAGVVLAFALSRVLRKRADRR